MWQTTKTLLLNFILWNTMVRKAQFIALRNSKVRISAFIQFLWVSQQLRVKQDQVSLRAEDFFPRHIGLQSGIIQVINLCHQALVSWLESTDSSGEVTKESEGKRFDVWESLQRRELCNFCVHLLKMILVIHLLLLSLLVTWRELSKQVMLLNISSHLSKGPPFLCLSHLFGKEEEAKSVWVRANVWV